MLSVLKNTGITFIILLHFSVVSAQDKTNNKFGKGIKITAQDSSFSMRFSTRIQTLYQGDLNLATSTYDDIFLIRRARLKFDGFAYTPKLTYKIELGLSGRDIGGEINPQTSSTAKVILDAVIKYNFYNNWSIWLGQTKLPGNIERVISSQQLQLVDRSVVNSRFNIDRDAGIQIHYDGEKARFIGAISEGEGRGLTVDEIGGGYDYTVRGEWLPMGGFEGDYSGADLDREPKPKLMLGVTFDYNNNAARRGGQLGEFMSENRTLQTLFVDAHFKYKGFSSMAEYAHKKARDGAVLEDGSSFYTGTGVNWQCGYLFKNNFEIAARYSKVVPQKETGRINDTQYTIGVSKYIVGHSLKIQSDATLIQEEGLPDVLMYRFQVELSF